MINGFININKKAGITSASVVNKVKKILYQNNIKTKIGHFGTLDPDGEGVLPIALGRATRLFDYSIDKVKTYYTEFVFGETSDTLDASGNIVKYSNLEVNIEDILKILPNLVGKIEQLPPIYSAKSINGVKAYVLARRGEEVELTPKSIEIFSITMLNRLSYNTYAFRIECSGGTYIRSLARDMASELDNVGLMRYIRRERSGFFTIENSATLEDVAEDLEKYLLPMSYFTDHLTRYDAPVERSKHILCGLRTRLPNMPDGDFSVYLDGEVIGIANKTEDECINIKTWLL